MKALFKWSRYLVLIAIIGLLVGAAAALIFGGITTATVIIEAFGQADYSAEGARMFSVSLIELIDLFLLGTILLITSLGLYQLFVEPAMDLPEWLAVSNLEQLKFNLLAVVVVMLGILFLGQAAGEMGEQVNLMQYGIAVAAVVASFSLAVWTFQRVVSAKDAVVRAAHLQADEERTERDLHNAAT